MTEPLHVLVVNARKTEPVERLRRDPSVRMSLITESGLEGLYEGVENVSTVDDIGDLKQVRETALRVIASQGAVDAVFAPSERSLPTGGYLRSYLGLPGLSFDVANLFCNKFAMKQRLRASGIPVAASALAPSLAHLSRTVARFGLPALVKPAFGAGASHTFVVRDRHELTEERLDDQLRDARGPFVVEQFVDVVDEYHCDAVVVDGEVVFASVSRYFEPVLRSLGSLFGSHTLPAASPESVAILELNRCVVSALGLGDGVTHLEVFRNGAGDYVVGEIACRPGGGGVPPVLRAKYGIDTEQLFLDSALGRPVDARADEQEGVFLWCVLPLRRGRIVQVSGPEDFEDIPEVLSATMAVAPGDVVSGTLFSTSMAGLLICRTSGPEEVPGLLSEIRKRFTIHIEPEEN